MEKTILYWLVSQDTARIELNENLVAIIPLVPKRLQTIHGHHLLALQGMSHKTSVLCKFYLQKKKKILHSLRCLQVWKVYGLSQR